MELIPNDFKKEISIRIDKIKKLLANNKTDALLVSANPNIYYTSGRFFRGYTYIPIVGEPLWFVIKPNVFDKQDNVIFIRKPEDIISCLLEKGYKNPGTVALEENDLSYSDVMRLKAVFPEATMTNGSKILKEARMVKTAWELNEMRADGIHHVNVYTKVTDCYKPGMTDLQLQIEIEKKLRLEGSLGVSRVAGNLMEINMGSLISGENADNPAPYEFTMGGSGVHPVLPVGADNSPILPATTVMIDMNGAFNGYQTDMTRVWSLGKIPEIAMKAHDCSINILRTLENIAIPGYPVAQLYDTAVNIVRKENLEKYFMGHRSQVGFIGHGVGIQLNELPVLTAKSKHLLEENMTIAIEPKFVIPHVGAVGVENTYVVTKNGLENLTVFPEEIHKL